MGPQKWYPSASLTSTRLRAPATPITAALTRARKPRREVPAASRVDRRSGTEASAEALGDCQPIREALRHATLRGDRSLERRAHPPPARGEARDPHPPGRDRWIEPVDQRAAPADLRPLVRH